MLKLILVDDEKNVREALSQILADYAPHVKLCQACASLAEALTAIDQHQPDVLFLDIEIGNENGFDIFKHYPKPNFKIIFITAYQGYAIQAFRFAALDYLLKPVNLKNLLEALEKANEAIDHRKTTLKIESFLHNLENTSKASKKVVLKTTDKMHVVNLHDIKYCEAERSYTTFYLSDQSKIVVSHNLGDYEEMFSAYDFFRIHKSFLLNLDYLKQFEKTDGGKVILKDGTNLPLSSRKKDELVEYLTKL